MRYYVMCRVSGGFTGTRETLLKNNGQVQAFDTREEAQAKADALTTRMNHQWAVASFCYWPVDEREAGAGRIGFLWGR